MDGDGSIAFPWGDGDQRFRLPIAQLIELQDKCNAGPAEILARLSGISWRVQDVRETIRLGLIGGGKSAIDALVLVSRYVVDGAWLENKDAARVIIMAALAGRAGDPVGKPTRRRKRPTPASGSPPTTVSAP